jgi:hypothetical protein
MKKTLLLTCLVLAAASRAWAADSFDAVRQADDVRVAALIAADRAQLGAVLSDDYRYTHSSGLSQGKPDYIAGATNGHTVFKSVVYESRDFKAAGPGVDLMFGRVKLDEVSAGKPKSVYLGYLAVWRQEAGTWRMMAWQSTALTAPKTP